jgi:hypothetical protein
MTGATTAQSCVGMSGPIYQLYQCERCDISQRDTRAESFNFSAILTKSASEPACILRIT